MESTTSDPEVNPQRKSYSHHNYGPWLWRRTQEKLEEQVNGSWQVVRQVDFGQDRDGNLTRKVSFNNQGDDVVETFDPDPYGNIESQTNARGYSTHIVYDSRVHTYPVETSNCAGHTATKQWDYAFGKPDWEEDPNQTLTDYTYDRFGRPTRVEVFDKNNVRAALALTQYFVTNRPAYVKKRVLEKMVGGASYIDTWQYFDGLGRTIQSVHRGEDGQPVVSRVFYDKSGRQYDSYGPYPGAWSESNPEG
ncbi:MAG: hypothetical protein HZB24_06400, partial [Desulfobacterales bacterium]|nr:hypothetical protein [Desulfobacterales bacterium]